jgi:hypothetical protein
MVGNFTKGVRAGVRYTFLLYEMHNLLEMQKPTQTRQNIGTICFQAS